jgi:hypothetical protein
MLICLQPDQVAKFWDLIKLSIEKSAPPIVKRKPDTNRFLEAAYNGVLQVWVERNDVGEVVCVLTTAVTEDFCSGGKNLVIYSLYSVGEITRDSWVNGYNTIKEFARSKGCDNVVGYTTEEVVKRLARFFGGDASFTYVMMEV